MKVIIVGGVAGGASCAARLRRLDEQAEIVMVERGPYVSYANCGLPYHVGSVIEHESDLLVASPEVFRRHFNVDCRTGCEAIGISPRGQDRAAARRRDRRRHHRVLRQARAVAGRAVGTPAAARHRPSGHLRGAHRARRAGDPRVDRTRYELPRRDGEVLGLPDGAAADARGGGRRRVHRLGDGREPRAPRVRRHGDRDGRSGARSARPGVRPTRGGLPRAARRPCRRR